MAEAGLAGAPCAPWLPELLSSQSVGEVSAVTFYNLDMFVALSLVGVLAGAGQPAPSVESARQELRKRVAAYTARDEKSPAALRPIAQLTLDVAAHSNVLEVWLAACSSDFLAKAEHCRDRLWRTLNEEGLPVSGRVRAGALLMRRNDKAAGPVLSSLVARLTTRELAAVAQYVGVLPAANAAPPLLRLLASPETGDKVAACRVLGGVDTAEVRAALRAVVASSSTIQQPWTSCQIARARLKESDSLLMISGFSRHLQGEDLLDAADALMDISQERSTYLFGKLTREASGIVQLEAAELLAPSDPATAARVVDARIDDSDPRVRAQALVVERRLKRLTDPARAKLLDKDEFVRVRGAETVLEWAAAAQ